jgi:ABC-2 type transport system permease protein
VQKLLRLISIEAWRTWLIFRRYPSELILSILSLGTIFYLFLVGVRYVAGPDILSSDRIEVIIVGYVLWTISIMAFGDMAWTVQDEARTGTLEMLYQSPYGADRILLARAVAKVMLYLALNIFILLAVLLMTQQTLSFSWLAALPFMSLLMTVYGLAFMLGGFALLIKRVNQLLALIQYGLLALIMLPVDIMRGSFSFLFALIPISPNSTIIRNILARGETPTALEILIVTLAGAIWLLSGLAIYRLLDKYARKRGLLSGY